MWWAYSGAARLTATISRNSTSAAIAMRLRRSRRPASAHGLRPAIAGRRLRERLRLVELPLPCAALASELSGRYFDSQSWSIRMYHCGFHW